ncbi:MAG TPA: diguanylate cyclase [Candidatus Aminicenantes bacterium]|nr:diguanylate cyclase [Candidatus Aminicenantes bacterium]
MARHLGLITCSSFRGEALACRPAPEFEDVKLVPLPVRCDQAEAVWPGLAESVAEFRRDGHSIALAGGYCLMRPAQAIGPDGDCRLHQKSQCFEWVAGKDVLDKLLQTGAMLLLPGWLADWEAHVDARWPGDPKAAQAYFREAAKSVVLLDTGAYPGIDRELKAFARFLRLPAAIHPVGTDLFRLNMARIVLSWRLECEKEGRAEFLSVVRRRTSDLARIGHLFGAVASAGSSEDALAGVLEIFRLLLDPRETVFHSAESLAVRPEPEGSPVDRIVTLNADHAWSDDRRSLFLKVAHDREILGVLEIGGLDEPERRESQFDLALALARISGLALLNVRTARALAAERERAAAAEAALAAGEETRTRLFSFPLGFYRTTPEGRIVEAAPELVRLLDYPDQAALKAVNFWDLHYEPGDRQSWQAVLDTSQLLESLETQFRRRNGSVFWAKTWVRAARDARGDVLYYDGVIEDISRKKQFEERHAWDVRLENSVSDVSQRLLSPTPIEVMSALVLDHARRLTLSATGFVGHIDEETGALVAAALSPDARKMSDDGQACGERFHGSSGLWLWAIENQKPILTNMTSLDPRFTGTPGWHFPVRQFLAVPAVMSGRVVGLVVVANGENPYMERDLKAVERLATLYAIAVDRTRTENELRELSLVDELTKAYNRRGFLALAEQQAKVAQRTRKEMSLFYLDLDDLKRINDSFGHDAGDTALAEAVRVLREAFRDSDIVARLGGDEFVVLAIDAGEGKVASLTRRLRERLHARNARPEAAFPVSFSLGVSRYDPDKPCSVHELLAEADRRMYRDKMSKRPKAAAA